MGWWGGWVAPAAAATSALLCTPEEPAGCLVLLWYSLGRGLLARCSCGLGAALHLGEGRARARARAGAWCCGAPCA